MIDIACQLHDECPACGFKFLHLVPDDDDSLEQLKGFKVWQVLKTKLWGITKPRSLRQLRAYWGCCKYIAKQISDHNKQYTRKQIDFMVKVAVSKYAPQLIPHFISKDGVMYVGTISISFSNLKHLEACDFFNLAFQELADMGSMTLEVLKHKTGMKD